MHKIKYILNRLRYYIKLIKWARKHCERVKNYLFLVELRNECDAIIITSERINNKEALLKAQIQRDLINNILEKVITK